VITGEKKAVTTQTMVTFDSSMVTLLSEIQVVRQQNNRMFSRLSTFGENITSMR